MSTTSNPSRINGVRFESAPASDIRYVSLCDFIDAPLVDNKVICPFHADHKPSCHIYVDHFHCFACGAHGDIITWLMEVEGLTFAEAQNELENCEPRVQQSKPAIDARARQRALALWDQAKPITGTIAETYLAGRKIDVTQLPDNVSDVLRFHKHCPFGKLYHPCLIALFRDVETDEPAGILRTALTPTGEKIAEEITRKTYGCWHGVRAIKLWPVSETLVVGEGVETVLAAATQLTHNNEPLRPAWSFGSKGGLEKFLPIQGVKHLIILADNDADGGGQASARSCARFWAATGHTVRMLTPSRVKDFNDVVVRKGAL